MNNDSNIISGENHARGTVTKFNDVLNECNLFDTWRLYNPDIKEYTWSKRNPFVVRRLDYILTSSTFFVFFCVFCLFVFVCFFINQDNAILFRSLCQIIEDVA